MKHPCTVLGCDRAAIRTRDGERVCLYHPDTQPPPMDQLTGKLREPNNTTSIVPRPRKPRAPRPLTSRGPCSIDGCDQPERSRSLCRRHYEIARRNERTTNVRECDCRNGRCAACRQRKAVVA